MGKKKRKLNPAEKAAKRKRRLEYETVFMNGRMKRVRKPPTVEGIALDEFLRMHADPIFLHQEGLWEYVELRESEDEIRSSGSVATEKRTARGDEGPFP